MGWYLGYIIVYFLIMFGIGFYYFLKVKNADDYLIGGWSMGFWPIVGTVISTWCGASVFIGTVGLGFQVGASGYIRFSLASVIFTLILILAFGRALRRQRLYTLADLFGQRFGVRAGIIPSLLSAVVYAIPTTAMQYLAMSTIWSACFGMDVGNALVLSAVLVLAFTVLGGLPGTIVTDALQAVLIITGIVILAVASGFTYALYMVGLDKTGLKNVSPYKNSFYMAVAVSAGMLLYNIPTRKIVFQLPPKAFAYTFLIAVCTSLLAVILLQVGVRYLSATTAAVFCLFEPITCSLSGWLFLGESLRPQKIVGSLVILAAVAILMIAKEPRIAPSERTG